MSIWKKFVVLSCLLCYITFLSNLENQSSCDLCQFFFETDIENSKQDIRKNGGPHSAMFVLQFYIGYMYKNGMKTDRTPFEIPTFPNREIQRNSTLFLYITWFYITHSSSRTE